jgi:hypothetical protein
MRTPTKLLAARDPKSDDGVYVARITFTGAAWTKRRQAFATPGS